MFWENASLNSRSNRESMSPKGAKVLLDYLLDLKHQIEHKRTKSTNISRKKFELAELISDFQVNDEIHELKRRILYVGKRINEFKK